VAPKLPAKHHQRLQGNVSTCGSGRQTA
jgi:hypothetical protein